MTVDLRKPTVEPFATNLQNPSHMEWTFDDRLLVSEISTGRVVDITEGGDMRTGEPFAEGLESPASIQPTEEHGLLVVESRGGSVKEISPGANVEDAEPYAAGLDSPYGLTRQVDADGNERILVTEERPLGERGFEVLLTDITEGGDDHTVVIDGIPRDNGPYSQDRGDPEVDLGRECSAWPNNEFLTISAMGQVVYIGGLEPGTHYRELLEDDRLVATGLPYTRGMQYHEQDERIYVSEPYEGAVHALDPSDARNQRFDPPVVQHVGVPSCVRTGPDGEMYVCDRSAGVVYRVTEYRECR